VKIGFRPSSDEDEDPPPESLGIGTASGLSSGDDEEASITFSRHIYLAVQVGPFCFVWGRPE
jgi:hypothetical protein